MTLEEVIVDTVFCNLAHLGRKTISFHSEIDTKLLAQAIRQWIKERLPKEKTYTIAPTELRKAEMAGYNQALADCKKSLEEQGIKTSDHHCHFIPCPICEKLEEQGIKVE